MHIRALKDALMLCRRAKLTPFIWGHKGMGKSSSVAQFAKELTGNNDSVIDLRCAQMEASDIRGIPAPKDNRTVYYTPSQFPTEGEGVFFLDEVNRGEDDVLQAVFELVLDRSVGEYTVPEGWSIVCAGNYSEGDYTVNAFNDAAFLDRFVHLELTRSDEYMQQWSDHMTGMYGNESERVIQFVSFNPDHLTGKTQGELGFDRTPSPRSWESVLKVERAMKKGYPMTYQGEVITRPYMQEAYNSVIQGLIGLEMAIEYFMFSAEVTPSDVINNGVEKFKDKLDSLERGHLVGLIWGAVSIASNKPIEEFESKQVINILDLVKYMAKHKEKDLAVMMSKGLISSDTEGIDVGLAMANTDISQIFGSLTGEGKTWLKEMRKDEPLAELIAEVGIAK